MARPRLTRSFGFALQGLVYAVRTQPNARIHIAAAALAVGLGAAVGVSRDDWLWILLAIAVVWMAELFNTSIEYLCDVVSPERQEAVRRAKDIAAGAVLVAAIAAAAIGALVILPHIGNPA